MGAFTCLRYASSDPCIAAIVADSPFESIKRVALDLAVKKSDYPSFLLEGVFFLVRRQIQSLIGHDVGGF
jgi:hypothetical protein